MLRDITLKIVAGSLFTVSHHGVCSENLKFMDDLGKVYDVTEFLDGMLLRALRN